MWILNKTKIAIMGLLATSLLPTLVSCDKQEITPATVNSGINSSSDQAQIALRVEEPTIVALEPEELNQIREIFNGLDPSQFVLEIEEDDKVPVRLGSAAIRDLERTGAYYSSDFSSERKVKVSKIVTKIITKIVVKKFLDDDNNVAQLAKVENILNTAASR